MSYLIVINQYKPDVDAETCSKIVQVDKISNNIIHIYLTVYVLLFSFVQQMNKFNDRISYLIIINQYKSDCVIVQLHAEPYSKIVQVNTFYDNIPYIVVINRYKWQS